MTRRTHSESKIHLNNATRDDLKQISGVGDELADAIIRYRDEHGKFKNKEEIDQIPGFSQIRTDKVKNAVDL